MVQIPQILYSSASQSVGREQRRDRKVTNMRKSLRFFIFLFLNLVLAKKVKNDMKDNKMEDQGQS